MDIACWPDSILYFIMSLFVFLSFLPRYRILTMLYLPAFNMGLLLAPGECFFLFFFFFTTPTSDVVA